MALSTSVMTNTRRTAWARVRVAAAMASASSGAAQSSKLLIGETRPTGGALECRRKRTSLEGREATAGLAGRRGQPLLGIGAREDDAGRRREVTHGLTLVSLLHVGQPDGQRDRAARRVVGDGLEVVAADPH